MMETEVPWITLTEVSKFWSNSIPSLRKIFQFKAKTETISKAALFRIQWMLKPGKLVAIMGHNGAGKTTLLRILSGISAPSSGKIEIKGKVVSVLGSEGVFHPDFTIYEAIALHGSLYLMDRKTIQEKIPQILEWSGLDKNSGKTLSSAIRTLSTGMQGRLLFSIALSAEWDVLLVDEVFANLDSEYRDRSLDLLQRRVRQGASVAVVTHDALWAKNFCDEIFYLDNKNPE